MPELNFNALATEGPRGALQGFMYGQQLQNKMLADQQAMELKKQEQQLNALRISDFQKDRQLKVRMEKANLFKEGLLRAPTPEAARSLIKRQYSDPDLGPFLSQSIPLEDALAEISDDPVKFDQYKTQEALGIPDYMKSQMPKVVGNAIYLPSEKKFITAPSQRLVPVIGPDKQPKMVPADEASGMVPLTAATAKMAGIGGTSATPKPLTQLQKQSFQKEMAADTTSVKAAQSVSDELEKLTDELVGSPEKNIAPAKGLSGITGYQAMLPSFPNSEARKAQQKLDTLKGKVMAFGRQLASLQGKLGNMAVQEWKFVSDSIQSIDPAAGNLDQQLRDIVRQAKNFANTMQERYDLTYESDNEEMPNLPPLPSGKGKSANVDTTSLPVRTLPPLPGGKGKSAAPTVSNW